MMFSPGPDARRASCCVFCQIIVNHLENDLFSFLCWSKRGKYTRLVNQHDSKLTTHHCDRKTTLKPASIAVQTLHTSCSFHTVCFKISQNNNNNNSKLSE